MCSGQIRTVHTLQGPQRHRIIMGNNTREVLTETAEVLSQECCGVCVRVCVKVAVKRSNKKIG